MRRWRAQAYLVILAAVCIAAGIVVPFLPERDRDGVLASGLVLGGLAMLVVALAPRNGKNGD
jgi:peptidoglycan/LPS O-acetylase OafA/YrhL